MDPYNFCSMYFSLRLILSNILLSSLVNVSLLFVTEIETHTYQCCNQYQLRVLHEIPSNRQLALP